MNDLEKKLNDIQQRYEQLHSDIQALQELNFNPAYGGATDWKNSLKRCLFD